MSAASFLGIAGLVALRGYDGMIYATGWLVGWPALMFLIAEPVRNLGKFTFADVVAFRLRQVPVRIAAAFGGILTVLFYTIAQMVGAGNLISLMFGMPYEWAVAGVGAVMLAYVLFGGMIATTWVQIIKAVLLLFGVTVLTGMVLAQFDFSPARLYAAVASRYGQAALEPGGLVTDPRRCGLARARADARPAGPAAHPDALLHRARRARGPRVGALRHRVHRLLLSDHPDRRLRRVRARRPRADLAQRRCRRQHGRAARGGAARRHAVPRLHRRGRLRDHSCRRRRPDARRRQRALARHLRARRSAAGTRPITSRSASRASRRWCSASLAVLLGIVFKGQNVAFMVGLAFAIACSANFPPLLLSIVLAPLQHRRRRQRSIATGAVLSVLLIVLSPTVWVDILHNPQRSSRSATPRSSRCRPRSSSASWCRSSRASRRRRRSSTTRSCGRIWAWAPSRVRGGADRRFRQLFGYRGSGRNSTAIARRRLDGGSAGRQVT